MKRAFSYFKDLGILGLIGAFLAFVMTPLAGWINHIIYCLEHREYVLLLVGAIAAPIGSIHGIGLWFNFW